MSVPPARPDRQATSVTLQITPHPDGRFLGAIARYKALKGNGRGYRSIKDAGPGASCITLGRSGLEAP